MPALVSLAGLRLRVTEIGFRANSGESSHAEHIVTCLHRSIDPNELTLQANVHDVHVYVHCVLAIWIHIRRCMPGILVWILAHQKISLVLWID